MNQLFLSPPSTIDNQCVSFLFFQSLLITMAEVMDNSGGQHFVQVPQAMISSANNQPVVMIQPSAIPMQTVQLGNQQLVTLSPVNQSPQILENYLKAEHKALGVSIL